MKDRPNFKKPDPNLIINLFLRQRYRQDVDNRRWEDQLLEQPDENNQFEGNLAINIYIYIELYDIKY